MSQSVRALSPVPSSHSFALLTTCDCSLPGRLQPLLDERLALRVGQLEEVVLGGLEHRLGAGQRRVGVLQRGGGVHAAAVLAGVAVLVLGAAVRALALDVAVGEEHALHRVVELLDRLDVHQTRRLQLAVDVLRQLGVLRRVRRVPVVERDMEALQIGLPASCDLLDERFGRLAGFFRGQHDRRAVGVVGADEMHFVALHALEAHPDIGLDVLHDVADMERPVCIGQSGGDEELAGCHEGGRF